MKYLAKDGFYSMCTQEKETKTVAKDFFFFFNVRLLLKKTSANSSYSQSLLTFFFLKVRCTPFYCFMACFFYLFIIILKKKVLVFTEFKYSMNLTGIIRLVNQWRCQILQTIWSHLHYIISLYLKPRCCLPFWIRDNFVV